MAAATFRRLVFRTFATFVCASMVGGARLAPAAGAVDGASASSRAVIAAEGAEVAASKASAVRVEVEFFQGDATEPSNRATVSISNRRVRIEQRGPDGASPMPVFLYRGDRNLLYSIVAEAKAYAQIAPTTLTRMGGSARGAQRELAKGMDGVPDDQRRLFGHLLGLSELDPAHPGEPLVVTHSKGTSSVAGVACRAAEISRGNRLLAKGCVADWDAVGLAQADVEVFRSLADLVRNATGARLPIPIEMVPGQPLDFVVQLGGFPLFFERAGQVAGSNAIRVARVERFDADEALFDVPAGYAARSGPGSIGGLFAMFRRRPTGPVPAAPAPLDDERALDSVPSQGERLAEAASPSAHRRPFDPWRAARPANQRPIRLFEGAE